MWKASRRNEEKRRSGEFWLTGFRSSILSTRSIVEEFEESIDEIRVLHCDTDKYDTATRKDMLQQISKFTTPPPSAPARAVPKSQQLDRSLSPAIKKNHQPPN